MFLLSLILAIFITHFWAYFQGFFFWPPGAVYVWFTLECWSANQPPRIFVLAAIVPSISLESPVGRSYSAFHRFNSTQTMFFFFRRCLWRWMRACYCRSGRDVWGQIMDKKRKRRKTEREKKIARRSHHLVRLDSDSCAAYSTIWRWRSIDIARIVRHLVIWIVKLRSVDWALIHCWWIKNFKVVMCFLAKFSG